MLPAAEVVRLEMHSRADLVNGRTFGPAGPFEKIAGKIFFAVDLVCQPYRRGLNPEV